MNATGQLGLTPIQRRSVSDAVFEQLRDQILRGERAAGTPLPAERQLCEAMGVARGAVREALRRLQQARLISVRHGGTSTVLDYREHAGLDLLGSLLVGADGRFEPAVVRGIMEMRSAIAPDAARLAARRRSEPMASALRRAAGAMAQTDVALADLQQLALDFWSLLIDAADNVAYRLAFNSLGETYALTRAVLAPILAEELRDTNGYRSIAIAVDKHEPQCAEDEARRLVRRGEAAVIDALQILQAEEGSHGR